jgi:hypothetical protein
MSIVKLIPTNLQLQHILNNYLLTITYSYGNNYTAKTFSFKSRAEMFRECDKLINAYPWLRRKFECV